MAEFFDVGTLDGTVKTSGDTPIVGVSVSVVGTGNCRDKIGPVLTAGDGSYSLAVESTSTSAPADTASYTKAGYTVTSPPEPIAFDISNLDKGLGSTPINVTMAGEQPVADNDLDFTLGLTL